MITTPALLAAVLIVIQIALLFHAKHVAQAAAEEGAVEARRFDGTAAAADEATHDYLAQLGPTMINEATVAVTRTSTTASVRVEGEVAAILPVWTPRIVETASGPVERFVQEQP